MHGAVAEDSCVPARDNQPGPGLVSPGDKLFLLNWLQLHNST